MFVVPGAHKCWINSSKRTCWIDDKYVFSFTDTAKALGVNACTMGALLPHADVQCLDVIDKVSGEQLFMCQMKDYGSLTANEIDGMLRQKLQCCIRAVAFGKA